MALHFLLDGPATADAGGTVTLTGAEAHHALAVRRVRVGEQVTAGDGRGTWLTATVQRAEPGSVTLRVDSRAHVAAPVRRLVLVQALAKGDRDELAVQAATELGVDEVVPWQAARSVSRWEGAKAQKGRSRWTTIVREAAKQAHRSWLPVVAAPQSTAQLAERAPTCTMLVLEPAAAQRLSALTLPAAGDLVLVVGPEGGIAPAEHAELTAAGALAVRLGDTVLRTSTAGPAAIAAVSAALGRW